MGPDAGAHAAGAVVRAVPGRPVGGRPGARHRTRRADARRDRRRTRRPRRRRCSTTCGCARQIAERETRTSPCVAAAATAGRQRRVGVAAPRRHHQHHPRAARRPGGGARARPRRGRSPSAGAHREPVGGPDLVGGLLRRVGAGGHDDAAEAGRAPPAAGAPRSGVGAAVGAAGLAVPKGRRSGGAGRPRRRPRTGGACASSCSAIPRTACPIARSKVARSPSAICAWSATTTQIRQKVAAATNSLARTFDRIVVLLAERGFIRDADGDPKVTDDGRLLARIYSESDLLVAECLRSGAWEGSGARGTGRRCCRRCSTSRGATRPGPAGRRGRRPASCAARWPTPGGSSAELRADEQRHRHLAEPRARRGLRRRRLPVGHHRRPGRRAGRIRHRPAPARRCRRATSCGGAVRFSICSTRCAMPLRRRNSGPPRNAQSPTFGAASSLLMQGRVSGGSQLFTSYQERR